MKEVKRKEYIIKDKSSNLLLFFFIVILAVLFILLFSAPLIGIFVEYNKSHIEFLDWFIASSLSFFSLGCAFFVLKTFTRGLLSYEIIITYQDDCLVINSKILGMTWSKKKYTMNHSIQLSPIYLRGDWGYCIWLSKGKFRKKLLKKPILVANNIDDAKFLGLKEVNKIVEYFGVNYLEDDNWEKLKK